MDKNVLVSVSGMQYDINEEEPIETVSLGEYYLKNGKHYIFYKEIQKEEAENTSISNNCLKITSDCVELTKKGTQNNTMVFNTKKKTANQYHTPFGSLFLEISTARIDIQMEVSKILVTIEYSLDMNGSHLSDCFILISVQDRSQIGYSQSASLLAHNLLVQHCANITE